MLFIHYQKKKKKEKFASVNPNKYWKQRITLTSSLINQNKLSYTHTTLNPISQDIASLK